MKIVCDDRIPYIREALASLTDNVLYKEGRSIAPDNVRDADALIVRTRTHCDRALLEGSRVQIVVTATIGYDHIDTAWLYSAGIKWTNCPGCNATSVAQWVRESLLAVQDMAQQDGTPTPPLSDMSLGIVGYGHVGKAVENALRSYVKDIVINDPPLGLHGDVRAADIITMHTPLTRDGQFPTWHLADERFFASLTHPVILINAARGGVVDEAALLHAMEDGRVSHALIDTWEGEPDIDRTLLSRAAIATPHIAGYSADGKANASRMAVEAVARHFGLTADMSSIVPPQADVPYDPRRDSDALKADATRFEWLRGNYPVRRE